MAAAVGKRPAGEQAYMERVAAIDEQVRVIRLELNEVMRELDSTGGGKNEYAAKKTTIRASLDEVQALISEYEGQKKRILDKLQQGEEPGKKKKADFMSDSERQQRILEIERDMMLGNLPAKQEKRAMAEIEKLHGHKTDMSLVPMRTQLENIKAELNQLYTKRRAEQDKLNTLMAARTEATAPLKSLFDKKQSLQKKLQELRGSKEDEMKAMRTHQREQQAKTNAARNAQKEKWLEQKQSRELKKQQDDLLKQLSHIHSLPLQNEHALLTQTISFIDQLLAPAEEPEAPKPAKIPEGVVLPKSQRDFTFMEVKGKKGAKRANRHGAAYASVAVSAPKKGSQLILDVGTLGILEQFSIKTPTKPEEYPATRDALCLKLKEIEATRAAHGENVTERKKALQAKLDAVTKQIKDQQDAEKASAQKRREAEPVAV